MPEPTQAESGTARPVRIPEADLETIEASVRKLLDRSAEQARRLDALAEENPVPFGAVGRRLPSAPVPAAPPEPRPILELDGPELDDEIDALTGWVDGFLMPTHGAEVTTASPWCRRWQEHQDVLAWLHALWLAYQQHAEPEAGPAGMLVWHRDFLTHTMAVIRAPGGPLSACMTDPDRPAHRLLPRPQPSTRTTDSGTDEEDGDTR
ncbi:DUF4913 domain-containing protein [Streptomyces sp. RFCAC02]|uniref:DUF4913 domain-containing protein n=1 Tax=Streptomyces sp. RFCAC02 TaxID=2499143 RepID=UPI00101F4F0A|nr:DUF4913 domain-containing protein [Streptomyces sp. RFCAC02]